MRKLFQDYVTIFLAVLLTSGTALAMQPAATNEVQALENTHQKAPERPQTALKQKDEQVHVPKIKAPQKALETVKPKPTPAAPVVLDNETIVWNYLIAHGFTRNQTAGIMGNLQQEHNFQTDGDGLAQWTGGRKANLLARTNPYGINTQLDFLLEELKTSEVEAYNLVLATDTVENSAIAFQDHFERCNPQYCMQAQRIQYAYAILNRH